MDRLGDQAVVLGGSIAGIVAARVLADSYGHVTLVERDRLPARSDHRRGVPQDRHVHGLFARGTRIIEALFPGSVEELVARGAELGRATHDATFCFSGSRFCRADTGLELLSVSRPILETHLRSRVLDLPNVEITEGCSAHGLATDTDGTRITGVRTLRREDGSAEQVLPADLVVDATGRASRTPTWLEELGYSAPEEETTDVGVTYTSCRYPRRPDDHDQFIVAGAKPPARRGGAAHIADEESWIVTLGGVLGEQAPTDRDGFVEYAASLPIPDIHELVRDRDPLGEPVVMRYPTSCRRRYDRLERFPEGLVVVGDAMCSFNPVYGQGMSVAAIEATILRACVQQGGGRIGPRFFEASREVISLAWGMSNGSDSAYADIEVRRSMRDRLVGAYLDRVLTVASRDPVVATAFLEVMGLDAHPRSLTRPRIVLRVLVGSLRRRPARIQAEREEAPRPAPASTPR